MSFYTPNSEIYIIGPTCSLGQNEITNEDFIRWIGSEIKPSLVERRTGINKRYWASEEQAVSDLGYESSLKLKDIDKDIFSNLAQLIFSTVSSDYPVPPSAPLLQEKLKLSNIGAFDLAAACAGFVTGLITASQMSVGFKKDVLLCSSEIRSKFLDNKDFQTSALFGDGSASCIISNSKEFATFRLISGQLFSDGKVADIISIPHGGSKTPYSKAEEYYPYLKMRAGAELYIKALDGMYSSSLEILKNSELTLSDIDWVVPHQANLHMIQALAKKLNFPMEKVVTTIKKYGNTSGASVGMALNELKESYPINSGDNVLLISAGGGGLAANAILSCL